MEAVVRVWLIFDRARSWFEDLFLDFFVDFFLDFRGSRTYFYGLVG